MEREAGLKRRFVLAVSNVVAAVGLVGLLSYAFLAPSDNKPGVETAAGPTLRVRIVEKAPELVLEEVFRVPPVVEEVPNILRAAIDDTSARLVAEAELPAPVATSSVRASFEVRRLVIGPDSGAGAELARPLVRQASLSPGQVFPRADFFDNGLRQDPLDDLSAPDTLIQEEGLSRYHDTLAKNKSVALTRTQDGNALIRLAFTPPPFIIRDVEADDRADLVQADDVAKKHSKEKVATRNRRERKELYCMAAAVYYEARGESRLGQRAVAQVVMNRVESKRYPNTVCAVVFQGESKRNRCQFSFACDGKPESPRPGKSWSLAMDIAKRFEGGERLESVSEALNYHADYVKPRWSRSMRRISKIGRHIFLKGT